MCGIAGLYNFRNQYDSTTGRAIVSQFCQLLSHRGPDATGLWASADNLCILGHTRLAVIDLDQRSNQPMADFQNRYIISFNGEIYNFHEIKKTLQRQGTIFKTESDTEVLLEAYVLWGEKLFTLLDGMFAIAIYDTQEKTLRLVRDRVGEKPLYYAMLPGAIAFSSELKPLLITPGLDAEVSRTALFEYLTLRYIADPDTLYKNIKTLQPGTELVIRDNGSISEKNYFSYDIKNTEQRKYASENDYIDQLDVAISESIKTRLIADVPIGAFLSSGIDSSLVCAIAAKKYGSHVKCFSAGFVAGEENENPRAQEIAEYLGLPFESYLVTPEDVMHTASQFGTYLDSPNGDRSCVPTFFLSQLIRSQVTVAVSGDGGDELFGGYGRYANLPAENKNTFSPAQNIEYYFSNRLPVFPLQLLKQCMPEEYHQFQRHFISKFIPAFTRNDLTDIERLRLLDFHTYMPGAVLSKVDRMSMQHSLEVRTPFYNPDVLNLSQSLPAELNTNGNQYKLALRKLLSRYLPQELIFPGKQGFGMPASFFQRFAAIFENLVLNADQVLFNWDALKEDPQLFANLQKLSRSNINSFWAWIVLGQWIESISFKEPLINSSSER